MDVTRRTLLEKLARDAGFDRVAREHQGWLVVGASHFAEDVWLRADDAGRMVVATLNCARSCRPDTVAGVSSRREIAAGDGVNEARTCWHVASEEALA